MASHSSSESNARSSDRNVIKHGIGYDLVIKETRAQVVVGIRCQTCQRVSYNPYDINERYCGHCQKFHEANLMSHEG